MDLDDDADDASNNIEDVDVDGDGDVLISSSAGPSTSVQVASSSGFDPLPASAQSSVLKNEFRRITIPPHRMSPLKRDWVNLYTPMVEMLGLQVRMNVKRRAVELKVCLPIINSSTEMRAYALQTSSHTVDSGAVQKGADFVKAFALGFDVSVRPLPSLHLHASSRPSRYGKAHELTNLFLGRFGIIAIGRSVPRFIRDQRCQNASR